MKILTLLAAVAFINFSVSAQTNGSVTGSGQTSGTGTPGTSKGTQNQKKLPPGTTIQGGKVVPQSHGTHDYTPGSPVGTGGAGEGTSTGSPQGSASENAIGKNPSDELLKKDNGLQKNSADQSGGNNSNATRSKHNQNVQKNSGVNNSKRVIKNQNSKPQ